MNVRKWWISHENISKLKPTSTEAGEHGFTQRPQRTTTRAEWQIRIAILYTSNQLEAQQQRSNKKKVTLQPRLVLALHALRVNNRPPRNGRDTPNGALGRFWLRRAR